MRAENNTEYRSLSDRGTVTELPKFGGKNYNNSVQLNEDLEALRLERQELKEEIKELKIERDMGLELVKNTIAISNIAKEKKEGRGITDTKYIMRVAANAFGSTTADMQTKSRKREHVYARNFFMYSMKYNTKMSLTKIGKSVNRHHSTVIHCLSSHEDNMGFVPEYRDVVEAANVLVEDYFNNKKQQ